jgi:hypothetical protein
MKISNLGIIPPGKLHFWEPGEGFQKDIRKGRHYASDGNTRNDPDQEFRGVEEGRYVLNIGTFAD